MCNSVLDPDFSLKGEALQYSSCLPLILIKQQSLTALDYITFVALKIIMIYLYICIESIYV